MPLLLFCFDVFLYVLQSFYQVFCFFLNGFACHMRLDNILFSFLCTFSLKPQNSEYFFFKLTILDFSSLISSDSRFRSHFITAINTLFASSRVRQNTLKPSAYLTNNISFNLVFLSSWYLTFPLILPSDFNTSYVCLVGISSH